jgi:hypothetical protein
MGKARNYLIFKALSMLDLFCQLSFLYRNYEDNWEGRDWEDHGSRQAWKRSQ